MPNISAEIGQRIRIFRKRQGITVQELADRIHKSKASVSKYETGQTFLDVATLYDIAQALGVYIEQLLPTPEPKGAPPSSNVVPRFFRDLPQFFIYMYDGRSKSLNRCVVDVISHTSESICKVVLYLNVRSIEEYQHCECTYRGYMQHYDSLTHLILQNQDSPIEQVIITVLASFVDKSTKWGMFYGLSFVPSCPAAPRRCSPAARSPRMPRFISSS
ncbi:MAG: helix-turn-helix transcriptional regulator [Eubacteriales bacterium]|nr:helix-turn-helix transcriptional regulator [Eubacteriales bacterium]